MIDIKLIRENPDLVKENIEKRFKEDKLPLVDKIKKFDEEWRKLRYEEDGLRSERNKISEEINQLKKNKKDVKPALKKAKEIPVKIEKIQGKRKFLEMQIEEVLMQIPNILDKATPVGKDEKDNVEIRKWGKPVKPKFELKNHAELIEDLGFADFEAGRNNAGQGFNYLLGDVAKLDHALQRYGIDFLIKKGFTVVVPPMLINFETLIGALNGLKDFEDVVYKVDKENLYLIGTAEHSLVSFLKNKTVMKKDIPIKLCAVTPCFRKEIGAHGVDTKGLFRMHQFNKVEQVVFSEPEKSRETLEEMQKITEEFFKSLDIPFRVIEICSGDLGAKFSKQYDIEAWFPRQKGYREVTSAGNCTDFQARALNIKYDDKGEKKFVHVLNNTMVATSRAMVAILENFQQKDGSVKLPKVLWPYMNGVKVIGGKK
jgi:seryl-tRNA synthetase